MISLFRRSKSTVGLDVGSGFIKVAAIDHSGAEPVLARLSSLPLGADAIVEGEVMDPGVVVETIRGVMEALGADTRSVATAVGGRDVIVKKIEMDRMPQEDAREVIRWEAEQHVPFDMEHVQLDFQILDPDDEGLQMSVLLVAAKRELVDQKLRLIGDAGLTPSIIDVDAFALYNALEFNYPDAMRGIVGLVNVGHEVSTIIIMQGGAPVISRDAAFGSRYLREDLQRMRGLSLDEAEAVVQGRGTAPDDYATVFTDRADELVMGFEKALAFLALDGIDQGLGRLFLSGGGARTPGLTEALAQRLRVRTEVANPLQRLQVHPDAAAQFPLEELAPMLMLPIGLALRNAA